MTLQSPLILGPDEGEHWNFLNCLATVKVDGARAGGLMSVLEVTCPRGFGPPLHSHDVEDELFFLVDGEVRYVCGEADQVVGAGGTVFLPKQLPHQFQVLSSQARMFQVSTPAQFDDFVRTLGRPAERAVLPEPSPVDPDEVARVCADFKIQVLGPPPPPLD